jgi:hypothetical protein
MYLNIDVRKLKELPTTTQRNNKTTKNKKQINNKQTTTTIAPIAIEKTANETENKNNTHIKPIARLTP